MINVNQITAQMARMSDPALQQFAAMHKSDPYTLSLALSESNRRKQLRQGAQMGQQQPQAKVVDQEVSQMASVDPMGNVTGLAAGGYLPEEIGIGQLPAPNMKGMAEGGIVAFEDGGKVPQFQEGGSWTTKLKRLLGGSEEELSPLERMQLAYEQSQRDRQPVSAGPNPFSMEGKQQVVPGSAAYMAAEQATSASAPRVPGAAPAAPPPPVPGASPAGGIKPGGGQGINPAAGGQGLPSIMKPRVPGLAPEIKALNTDLPTAGKAQGISAQFLDEEKYAQQLEDFKNEEAASVAERRTKLEKSLGEMPERYKDYEGRLKAQEKEDAGDKEKLTGMSFLEAGLAVLSGESPHAFVNLGRAKEGVKTYNEGIKDIKKSARERDKAFADIENARQAQAEGKIDTVNRFEDSAAKSMSESKRFAVSGLQALGMKGGEMAKNTYDLLTNNAFANQRTQADAASKMQTTDLAGQYGLASAQVHANATIGAAKIRAETDREYSNAIRQGQLDVKTAGLINSDLEKWAKTNHYTQDDPEYQNKRRDLIRQYSAANPNMAQSGGAPGGGGAPSDYVYKDGKLVPRN
jgi:hypothetical protein